MGHADSHCLRISILDMASHCSSNAIHSPLHWFRSDVQCCLYRVFRASQSVLGHAALSRFPPILGHTNSQLYFSIHPAVYDQDVGAYVETIWGSKVFARTRTIETAEETRPKCLLVPRVSPLDRCEDQWYLKKKKRKSRMTPWQMNSSVLFFLHRSIIWMLIDIISTNNWVIRWVRGNQRTCSF